MTEPLARVWWKPFPWKKWSPIVTPPEAHSVVVWVDDLGIAHARDGKTGRIIAEGGDHASVIQSAIDYLSDGGRVFIRKGVYSIASTVTVPDGVTLEGEMHANARYYDTRGTVLRGSADPIIKVTTEKDTYYSGAIAIRNLRVRPASNNAAILASASKPLSSLTIENVGVVPEQLFKGYGIVLDASQQPIIDVLIRRVECYYLDKAIWAKGVYQSGSSLYLYVTTLTISKCTFERNNTAIRLEGVQTALIGNSIIENSQTNGVEVYASRAVWIADNHFENNPYQSGTTGYDLIVQGEPSLNYYTSAVYVRNNLFASRYAAANVYVKYSARVVIAENLFLYTPQNNIYADADARYLWIENNIFSSQNTILGRRLVNSGKATFSGNGATTQFLIDHGIDGTPTTAVVTPGSSDAKGNFYITLDSTYIYVNYATPPPSGSNNVVLYWYARRGMEGL